jgi:hypothetical protein
MASKPKQPAGPPSNYCGAVLSFAVDRFDLVQQESLLPICCCRYASYHDRLTLLQPWRVELVVFNGSLRHRSARRADRRHSSKTQRAAARPRQIPGGLWRARASAAKRAGGLPIGWRDRTLLHAIEEVAARAAWHERGWVVARDTRLSASPCPRGWRQHGTRPVSCQALIAAALSVERVLGRGRLGEQHHDQGGQRDPHVNLRVACASSGRMPAGAWAAGHRPAGRVCPWYAHYATLTHYTQAKDSAFVT